VILRVGVSAMIISRLCLLAIAVLPLLDIPGNQRATYAAALLVATPMLWWGGLALVGREAWRAARRHGWRQTPRYLWKVLRYGERGLQPSPEASDAGP